MVNYPQITMSFISSSSDESSTSKLIKLFLGGIFDETGSALPFGSLSWAEVQLEFCAGFSLTGPLRRRYLEIS